MIILTSKYIKMHKSYKYIKHPIKSIKINNTISKIKNSISKNSVNKNNDNTK